MISEDFLKEDKAVKELYVTIAGTNHYYGMRPYSIGKRIKCVKEKNNPYDNEAIRVTMKELGTVGYIANNPATKATGTYSAGALQDKVKKTFHVEVMFITQSKVICRVVDGMKEDMKEKAVDDEKKCILES